MVKKAVCHHSGHPANRRANRILERRFFAKQPVAIIFHDFSFEHH